MALTKEVNIVVKETGMDKVSQSIQQLEQSVQQTEQATKSFKAQIREAREEMVKMSQQYGATSKEAVRAAQKVADLNDQMGFANDLVKSFNPDQKFKALGSATQLAGTGLQGVTSGMALFGDQSESTEKALLQVQSAMAFSDAISNLSEMGDQWANLKTTITSSTVATKVNNVATAMATGITKLFGKAVDDNSKAFKGLKYAIIGTGIGALVVGLGLVVSNFENIKKIVSNIGWLKNLGDAIMGIVNAVTDFIGLTSESERVLDKQKAVAEKALKQNELYLKKNEHKLSEARKREIELSNEHFQRLADGEMSKEESLKILREKGNIDKQKADDDANKKALEKQKEANEKRAEANKIAKEKELEDIKKGYELEANFITEQLKNENLSFDEKRKIVLDSQKLSKEDRINFLTDLHNLEVEAERNNNRRVMELKKSYAEQLEDLNATTSEQKLALDEKRALAELEKLDNNETAKLELIKLYQKKKDDLATEKKKEEEEKAIEQKEIDAENEELDFETRLEKLQEREAMIKSSLLLSEEEKTNLINENNQKRKDIEIDVAQKIADAKATIEQKSFDVASQTTNLFAQLGAKNKAIQKATLIADNLIGIAKIVRNTQASNSAAITKYSLIPGGQALAATEIALNKVSAGIGIATSIATTAKALSALGGGGGGGDAGSGGGSTPAPPPAPSFNLVQGTGRNQIAEGIQNQSPLKAYVVAKDVTTGQSMDRNIIEDARL